MAAPITDRIRKAIDIHPQEALLADFPLDVNDFQPFRARYSLGGFANFFQLKAETPRPKPVSRPLHPAQQKSGLAPTPSCDPLQSEGQVYAQCKAKARHRMGRQITPSQQKSRPVRNIQTGREKSAQRGLLGLAARCWK